MESLLKNLKKHLTCSICLDIYNKPKTITCLHTFCLECLANHARASHRQGKFRCPECQAQIDLPEGNNFDRLPSSFFHNSMLGLLAVRRSGEGSSITCSQCRKDSSQVYYCFDCGRFMCPDCFSAHEVLKESFEGHRVTPVNEFKAEDYEALLKRQPFCSQEFHEKEITRFFCFSCEACVCQICIVTDHQNHKIVLLDKAARDEKPDIMSGAEMIKEKLRELGEVIRQFEETASELERNVATAKRGVSQAADQMIAEIREREREAIISLEMTRVTRLEKINTAIQGAQSLVKQVNQAVEFANNLTQRSSSSDIMKNKITLKQRFEELRVTEVPKHDETSFVKFSAASRVEDLKLGFIETVDIKADANRSWLEGLDQTFQAGVEAEFTLHPKTSEGKTSNQADLKDQVEVLVEPAKDVTNVIVSEKEDGNLQVKFTPIAPGAYSIEVKINGNKLSTCPFTTQTPAEQAAATKLRGNKYFKGGKFDQAIRCYTEAIDLCPEENKTDLATFYQNRAAAYEQQKNYEQVLADATKAIELNKKYSKAFMKRAQAYEKLGKKEECLQDLTAVCMIEGFDNPNWMLQADRVLKEIGREKAQEYYKNREPTLPSPTYTKAYLESFCHDDTLEIHSEEDLPEDSPFLEAVKQMKEKKYDSIVDLCTQQIEKGPGPLYIKAFALRGTLYTLISKVDEAVRDLTLVINAEDEQASTKLKVNCLIKRGGMQLQASNVMECFQDFNKAVSLDPDNSDVYHHRGQIHFLSEKLHEAKEDFEKCISLNDSFIPARIQLAYCIYKSAALQQSPMLAHGTVDMLQKTVEKYPESADAHSLYAQVVQEMQQFSKAEEHFDIAIKLEPQNPVHRVYKGLLMLQSRQDVEKAAELVNEALVIDEKCDFAYETLATLEVQRGNLDRAIELFNKAIDLVRTEAELAQTFSLREAAKAQKYVTETLGLTPPAIPFMS